MSEPTFEDLIDHTLRFYRSREERVAVRAALGDAAGICDRLHRMILEENRGRSGAGPTTKHGVELAAVAKRCGDTIWAMRDIVQLDSALAGKE